MVKRVDDYISAVLILTGLVMFIMRLQADAHVSFGLCCVADAGAFFSYFVLKTTVRGIEKPPIESEELFAYVNHGRVRSEETDRSNSGNSTHEPHTKKQNGHCNGDAKAYTDIHEIT